MSAAEKRVDALHATGRYEGTSPARAGEPRVEVARKQIIREEAEVTITLDEETAIDLVALACFVRRVSPEGVPLARFDALGMAVLGALTHAGVMVPDPEQRFAGTSLINLGLTPVVQPPAVVRVPVVEGGSVPEIRAGVVPKFV